MIERASKMTVLGLLLTLSLIYLPTAAAQSDDGDTSTLSVIGYGEATAPADAATIQIAIGTDSYGPPQPLQVGATPGARERESLAPVVASLVASGLIEEDITLIVGPYVAEFGGYGGPSIGVVRFSIDSPDPARISELVDAASVGASEERLLVNRVGVQYSVSDCAPLLSEARQMAIEDAREQAELQANLLNVSLGDLQAARDLAVESDPVVSVYGFSPAGNTCSAGGSDADTASPLQLPSFDPSVDAEVSAYAEVELTLEMEPNVGS